jgi:hypothetical protein
MVGHLRRVLGEDGQDIAECAVVLAAIFVFARCVAYGLGVLATTL